MRKILWIAVIFLGIMACSRPVPLNKKEIVALLIDMHTVDAMLSEPRDYRSIEKENYMYYNDLFKKYGISREDFDSIISYYSGKTEFFNKLYNVVVDSLAKREEKVAFRLSQLTKDDTVNILPGYLIKIKDTLDQQILWFDQFIIDTLYAETVTERYIRTDTFRFDSLNPYVLIELDGVTPGKYQFKTHMRFDSLDIGKRNRISAYFVSPSNDTLFVPNQYPVRADTLIRPYTQDYYLSDSLYNKLVIKFVDSENIEEVAGKRSGKLWGSSIFKQYVTEKELKRNTQHYRSGR